MTAPLSDLTVAGIPRYAARTLPHKCALDDGRRRFSYAELDAEVQRVAAGLQAEGIGAGDVVSAYLPNCIEYVVVVLAVARAGAIFSPINPRFKAYEIAAMLGQARPKCAFVTADRAAAVSEAASRAKLEHVLIVAVDAEKSPASGVRGYREWKDCPDSLPLVTESAFFSLMFTSGTTGEPKGALATHRARMIWVLNASIQYGLGEGDRYLGMMPQVHSAGLTFTLMHLYVGATVRILEHFDPREFLEIVERERVTSTLTVPTMLTMILEAQDKSGRRFDLSGLKRVVTCGSPLPLVTKQRVIERISPQLYDYYGSTESNSMSVLKPADQMRKPASVGQPFTNVEIMIASSEGTSLPANEVGEVWCANPSVMSRYLGKPQETEAAFSGRWFKTGDLGYLDEEGFLFIVGRLKDVIISGGVNIYPAEIEHVMLMHPAVLDCAVLGVADPKWGQAVKAFVVLREGRSLDLAEAQAHCVGYLADYKKPRYLEVVRDIPKNAGGKTVKTALVSEHRESA